MCKGFTENWIERDTIENLDVDAIYNIKTDLKANKLGQRGLDYSG
jgi:hypothetical protein